MTGRGKKGSIGVARFIPGFLVLIVAYVSYVMVGPLSINYFINPPGDDIPTRITLGIALPIVYFVLLLPVAATWLRLFLIVLTDPGYIPLGSDEEHIGSLEARPGLEYFWMKDVFVCDPNGLPIFCNHCQNWKPDRAHHSQDVGRCTRKMDHFCPWVGGVVGERAMKFFVQFLVYTMIFTGYITIVLAYVVSQYKGDIQLIVGLALAGFFLLFTMGMVMNSVNLVLQNTTTIENVSKRMYIAVVLPPELQSHPLAPPPPAKLSPPSSELDSERPLTSDFDDPSHLNYFSRQQALPRNEPEPPAKSPRRSKIWKGTITYPLHLPVDRPPIPAPEPRTFAILHTPPGVNPWNLSPYQNFTSVFGPKPHEWFLPLKLSPCCDHSSTISDFPLGPEFELLLVDAGLIRPESSPAKGRRSGSLPSRERKRRLDAGWQNGERPDGWISEKEARRVRNEWRRRAGKKRDSDVE